MLPSTNPPDGLSVVCKAGTWYVAPVGHPTPHRGEGPTLASALGNFEQLLVRAAHGFLGEKQLEFNEATERVRQLLVGRGDVVQEEDAQGGPDDGQQA